MNPKKTSPEKKTVRTKKAFKWNLRNPKKTVKKQKKPSYHQQRAAELKAQAKAHQTAAVASFRMYENCDRLSTRYTWAGRITTIAALLLRWAMKLTHKADADYKATVAKKPLQDESVAEETPPTANTGGMDWATWCAGIDREIAADKAHNSIISQITAE